MSSDEQPSPALLMTTGIKVRDFAYENTLPAIVPVPRVPRQVQPAPRPLKRSQRDWDDTRGDPSKKPRPLERKLTEPLHEPPIPHTRTLERITVRRVCSIIIPAPLSPHARFSASPPTSPLTPPLTQRDVDLPFFVHVDDTTIIPTSRADAESCRPARYTTLTLGSRSSLAPIPQHTSPAPITSPLPSQSKEREAPRVRKPRGRGTAPTTPAPNRYQLRQRPVPCTRQPDCMPRSRTRRMR